MNYFKVTYKYSNGNEWVHHFADYITARQWYDTFKRLENYGIIERISLVKLSSRL